MIATSALAEMARRLATADPHTCRVVTGFDGFGTDNARQARFLPHPSGHCLA